MTYYVLRRFPNEAAWQHWLTTFARDKAIQAASTAYGHGRCYVVVIECATKLVTVRSRTLRLPPGEVIHNLEPQQPG
jgi:hypothetical protein